MSNLFTRTRLIGLGFAVFIAAADQWVKWYVTGPLGINQIGDKLDLLPFFDLTYTRNYGISLGMLQATNMETRWWLVGMTALMALVALLRLLQQTVLACLSTAFTLLFHQKAVHLFYGAAVAMRNKPLRHSS